jgi:large subunit ribosomal protein L2
MSMKVFKPTSAGRRGMKRVSRKELSKPSVDKLLVPLKKSAGRSGGKITVRHRGGGVKRKYRLVDFKCHRLNVSAEVMALEYDPNRTAHIALIKYEDGEMAYIIAPQHLKVGDQIVSGDKADFKPGHRMPLSRIPVGSLVYNIELKIGQGGRMARSAGTAAQVLAREGGYVNLKLPSTEVRKVREECLATIGQVSNPQHRFINLGKAGVARRLGRRPVVRGSAMAAVDHPHGGGEGRTGIGLKHPKTKWGRPAYGVKTRRKKKASGKLILKRRQTKR